MFVRAITIIRTRIDAEDASSSGTRVRARESTPRPIAHAATDFFGAVSSSHFFASSLIVRSSIINFGLNSKK